jgi:hypothetical protein
MASSNASDTGSSASAPSGKPMDPIVRNAMRYSLSAREYQLLHKYLISRSTAVKVRVPQPAKFDRAVKEADDYNAAAVRAAFRVFLSSYTALKIWESVSARVFGGGKKPLVYDSINAMPFTDADDGTVLRRKFLFTSREA